MNAIQLIGVAGSLSFLAGWRLYATVAATGLGMRLGWLHLPEQAHALAVLANPWVIGVAALGAMAEFFTDKVPWLDSVWDAAHTIIRPLGGALLAMAVVDPSNPVWQVVVFLLGGGAALLSHGAKAGTRALVNVSPEPFSNLALSTLEDGASLGGLWLAITHPTAAVILAVAFAVAMVALIMVNWRVARRVRQRLRGPGREVVSGAAGARRASRT
ncbi:MAG: putative transrane protein [Caulobacteraceae bacterium]|nr:putative transrane protein [Caulobacteraceae bacterium]